MPFSTAGAATAMVGSPTPPQKPPDGTCTVSTLGISVVFFVIAQATLHLFLVLFRWMTLYAEDEEIIGENVAAALSYAGAMLAIAIIVGHAAEGDFEGWSASLQAYGLARFKWPERIEIVDAFPLTLSGKLSKPGLRELLARRMQDQA